MISKLGFYAVNNIFCILILLIISFHFSKQSLNGNVQNRLYMALLIQTIISLAADLMGRFDGDYGLLYVIFNRTGNFLLFFTNLIIPVLWILYVDYHLHHDISRLGRLAVPLFGLYLANCVFVIISEFTGWLYFIDGSNIYSRGPLFMVEVGLVIALIIFSIAEIILNRKKLIKKHFYSLLMFGVPPILGVALQTIFYGLSVVLNGIVLSLLIIFIMIQNEHMQTDFLTGLYNRYELERRLRDKMRDGVEGRFAVVMLDLNGFKRVNDTYGHKMGDKALKLVAQVLRQSSCINDFIARYGGDEFIIIYENIDQEKLEKNISMLEENLKKINSENILPCDISFSIGSAIVEDEISMTLEDLLQLVDCRLYENKRKNLE